MARLKLTRDIAFAAGADAANANRRKHGRKTWSREDYNIACQETNRLLDQIESEPLPVISEAAYAKGQMLVQCPSLNGFKTRAARLIGYGLKGRWVNRESGYIVSRAKAERFCQLYREGWDACVITGKLVAPDV